MGRMFRKKRGGRGKFKKGKGKRGGTKIRYDGTGSASTGRKHGKRAKAISQRLSTAIYAAQVPTTSWLQQSFANTVSAQNQCTYKVFEMGNAVDIANIQAVAGNYSAAHTGRMVIKDATMTVNLMNQESLSANVRIYEYVCRRDLPQSQGSTQTLVNNGFDDDSLANQITATTVGGTLFNCGIFCSYMKILNVRDVTLLSGKTLRLSMSSLSPKTINGLTFNTADCSAIGRYTRGFVVQQSGKLVDDIATRAVVGIGATKIISQLMTRYHFFSQQYSAAGTYISGQPAAPGAAAAMQDDAGGYQVLDNNA